MLSVPGETLGEWMGTKVATNSVDTGDWFMESRYHGGYRMNRARVAILVFVGVCLFGALVGAGSTAAQSTDADVLVVENPGASPSIDFLDRNGFSNDTVSMSEFANMSASEFKNYRTIWIQPELSTSEINDLRSGLDTLDEVSETYGFRIAIRVAGNSGSHSNIDFRGTDYDRSLHDSEMFVDSNHPLITGNGYGGHQLSTSNFDGWFYTDHGRFSNMPANRTEILRNGDGVSMFSYRYNNAFVVVDTLTSVDGGFGSGNDSVADNYINWLASREVSDDAEERCTDRRDLSRGQEDQECPHDNELNRGESHEDLDRETGRSSDTRRRDRGRRDRSRGR